MSAGGGMRMEGLLRTFEGGLNSGYADRSRREPDPLPSACMIVHEVSGHFVKMSGTAIILVYYRLKQ